MKKNYRVLLIFLLLFSFVLISRTSAAFKDISYGSAQVAAVTYVNDGDTFRCTIRNLPPIIGENIPVRIAHLDTPEMDDQRPLIKKIAVKARLFTLKKLQEAERVELREMRRDRYFRILARVLVDGQDLGKMLLKEGLAQPYEGGFPKPW